MTARLPSPRRMTDREIANEKRKLARRLAVNPRSTAEAQSWLEANDRRIRLTAEQSRRTAARRRARKGGTR